MISIKGIMNSTQCAVSYKQGNTSSKQVTEANIHGIMSLINSFMTSIMRWLEAQYGTSEATVSCCYNGSMRCTEETVESMVILSLHDHTSQQHASSHTCCKLYTWPGELQCMHCEFFAGHLGSIQASVSSQTAYPRMVSTGSCYE